MYSKIPMVVDIVPIPKPRMVASDRWKQRKCVLEYWRFCEELRLKLGKFQLANDFIVDFFIPMPDSWSDKKKKEMDFKYHQQRPDLSNLLKSLEDALMKEDSYIYRITATKHWAYQGQIKIYNYEKKY